jgi:predicted lipoprotein with Yx(FWY)xxD motif
VTAEVGTITGNDGKPQVTLDGHPVYLYAGDGAPGDVAGQGIQDIWWVVAPDGSEIETMASGSGGGY